MAHEPGFEKPRVGQQAAEERRITEEDVIAFARLSGDVNPLHVDAAHAATTTFGARIVHGAFQVALASALLGTRLPGARVLLGSINARFPAPLFYPARVRVTGEVTAWNEASGGGQLRVAIQEAENLVTTADISMGFTLQGRAAARGAAEPRPISAARLSGGKPLVVLTGAASELGAALVSSLAADYDLVAVVHRQPLAEGAAPAGAVTQVTVDLGEADAVRVLRAVAPERPLFGVIHAAWPTPPQGGLLEVDSATLRRQLHFGSEVCISLARLLFERAGEGGGRFVAISSTAASLEPQLSQAAYALGKACLDQVVRLLAPELARRKVTINGVAPSFMPLGINRNANERFASRVAAAVPLGRLCAPGDAVSLIRYLLSAEAAFLSGRVLPLTGGKL